MPLVMECVISDRLDELFSAVFQQISCFYLYHVLVVIPVIFFPDPGIYFSTVCEFFQFMQFGYIDEFPLYRPLGFIQETVLFALAGKLCLVKGMQFVLRMDQAQLLIKLRRMISVSADDAINKFCEIPGHGIGKFWNWEIEGIADGRLQMADCRLQIAD